MELRTCHRSFPSLPLLVLASIATAALVLLLAGWGIAFWIAAGAFGVCATAAAINAVCYGRSGYACTTAASDEA